ncbi:MULTISPECIES: hypothetical protein [Streptomyces]|uniref:Uncharacterized protein n=1 Tax=Streptomyces ramulosus TaxID=47762 RepID=A0ABW1FS24_9ACTN
MEQVSKYFANRDGYPQYAGPENLKVLGNWVTGDIQQVPYTLLEVIDLVVEARRNPDSGVEEFGGNAHYTEIEPQGVHIQNEYVDHVRGDFTLDQALDVLTDFWNYCARVHPERTAEDLARYVAEYGHDPVAGLI